MSPQQQTALVIDLIMATPQPTAQRYVVQHKSLLDRDYNATSSFGNKRVACQEAWRSRVKRRGTIQVLDSKKGNQLIAEWIRSWRDRNWIRSV